MVPVSALRAAPRSKIGEPGRFGPQHGIRGGCRRGTDRGRAAGHQQRHQCHRSDPNPHRGLSIIAGLVAFNSVTAPKAKQARVAGLFDAALTVIPGREPTAPAFGRPDDKLRERPESITHDWGLWIPGLRQEAHPGMTT
jgi:hypothetical protein